MSKVIKGHDYCVEWTTCNGKSGRHTFGVSRYIATMMCKAFDAKHDGYFQHRPVKIKK